MTRQVRRASETRAAWEWIRANCSGKRRTLRGIARIVGNFKASDQPLAHGTSVEDVVLAILNIRST